MFHRGAFLPPFYLSYTSMTSLNLYQFLQKCLLIMLIYNYCPSSQTSITAQESPDKVTDWCGLWLLGRNADKCESMKFTRARTPSPCNYAFNSKLLTQVSTHKHLGVVQWLILETPRTVCHIYIIYIYIVIYIYKMASASFCLVYFSRILLP